MIHGMPPTYRNIVENVKRSVLYRENIDKFVDLLKESKFMTEMLETVWNVRPSDPVSLSVGQMWDFMDTLSIMIQRH